MLAAFSNKADGEVRNDAYPELRRANALASLRFEQTPLPDCKMAALDSRNAYCMALQEQETRKVKAEQEAKRQYIAEQTAWLAQQEAISLSLESSFSAASGGSAASTGGAKAFIYDKESGNDPNAMNGSGCYGIGQDCNGVVLGLCGADYACQDAYFEGYMADRYGSWENAQAFWNANHWW